MPASPASAFATNGSPYYQRSLTHLDVLCRSCVERHRECSGQWLAWSRAPRSKRHGRAAGSMTWVQGRVATSSTDSVQGSKSYSETQLSCFIRKLALFNYCKQFFLNAFNYSCDLNSTHNYFIRPIIFSHLSIISKVGLTF